MSFQTLAAISSALRESESPEVKTLEDQAWEGSPFDWFRKKPSATKGRIGRDLVSGLIEAAGYPPSRQGTTIKVGSKLIRVKTSLMWGAGDFKFEQLRDNDYDFVFCLGLYPMTSYGWLVPKEELIVDGNMQDREGLTPQHGGMSGTEDFWLTVNVANIPDWLAPYGGTTEMVLKVIAKSF